MSSKRRVPIRPAKDHLRLLRLVNFETGEYVTILPSLGGRVHEIVLKAGKKLLSMLESPTTAPEILENKHFAGVKLIPFAGRIVDATYQFNGRTHKFQANSKGKFAIHGFIADRPFRITKSTAKANRASVVLSFAHKGTTKGYPFKFLVRLTFVLKSSSFTCMTEIKNTDTKPIPVGDGWHPYFKTRGSVTRLLLSLPAHSVVEVTPKYKVPTGETREATSGRSTIPLRRKVIDSVFDFGEKRRRVTTELLDPKLGLRIQLWQEAGKGKYRYLVLYRPASGTSVAIEPWTCAPNAFNNGMGLIVLKPGGRFRASYGVRLRQGKLKN